jgi:hypothetical protein
MSLIDMLNLQPPMLFGVRVIHILLIIVVWQLYKYARAEARRANNRKGDRRWTT